MGPATELDLVRRSREGDRDSFARLVDLYGGSVLALAYGRVGNYADSQDIAQDAFVLAFENLDQLRKPQKFGAWLKSITANLCRRWRRSQAYQSRLREDSRIVCERLGYPSIAEPDERLKESETRRVLDKALGNLSPQDREAITLFYLEQRSVAQAAQLSGISVAVEFS